MEYLKHSTRLRSFGRLASHMSAEEKAKLDARLAPVECVLTHEEVRLDTLFGRKTGKIILELGMGNGETLAHRAKTSPEDLFIGCEVYKNGLRSLLVDIEKNALQNIRICAEDARHLLEQLPKESIDEVVLLYPDPWPKKKHNKRRIVNVDFLSLVDRVLKEDGVLFMATDIPDYMMWMLREVYTHNVFFPTATSPEEWATAPHWWCGTKYERKAVKQGRSPWYMSFKRNVDRSNTKCEADVTQHA